MRSKIGVLSWRWKLFLMISARAGGHSLTVLHLITRQMDRRSILLVDIWRSGSVSRAVGTPYSASENAGHHQIMAYLTARQGYHRNNSTNMKHYGASPGMKASIARQVVSGIIHLLTKKA